MGCLEFWTSVLVARSECEEKTSSKYTPTLSVLGVKDLGHSGLANQPQQHLIFAHERPLKVPPVCIPVLVFVSQAEDQHTHRDSPPRRLPK